MNLTLTNLNQPAPPAMGAAPAANDAAAPVTLDAAAAAAGTAAVVDAGQPALAFAQWLGLDQMAPVKVDAAVGKPEGAPAGNDLPVEEEQQAADTPLLGAMAMSMPLMPMAQATLAAVVAALPGVAAPPAAKESAPAADTKVSPSVGSAASGRESRAGLGALPAAALPAAVLPASAPPAAVLAAAVLPAAVAPAALPTAALPAAVAPAALPAAALPAAVLPAAVVPAAVLPASAPALPLAETPVQAAAAKKAPAAAAKTAPAAAALAAATPAADAEAPQDQAAPLSERGAANTVGIAGMSTAAAGTAQRSADTVTLSGPPTAWRQTLQEALGERLQLQVGNKAEQAVIRLDPPMLGRVEIAIRHSAGSLEVHISATHSEVLRQLQTVSENLRSDLAQRQFTDVSVNVAPAARGANGAPMFAGGEGRGRQQDGRQQDGNQEQNPGNALAEAHTATSAFSLNGRGQGRG